MKILLKWNFKNSCQLWQTSNGKRFYLLFTLLFTAFSLISCSTVAKLPPSPPKYVYEEETISTPHSVNSLWEDSASLYEDTKARRLNDLVIISLDENISGSGKADTKANRDSSAEYEVSEAFGMNKDFNLHNVIGLKDFYKGSNVFEPKVSGTGKSEFKGEGDTSREGRLRGTIAAKIVEVMPNGNLILESRKEITINNEKQILIIRGMVRPYDIDSNNTVLSSKVADAEVYYVGDGIIQDKQRPGWLVRLLDKIWPF